MNKLFLILLAFAMNGCEKQLRATFDPILMIVETCDKSIIKEIEISVVGDQTSICTIKLEKNKHGKSKIKLTSLDENYYYIGAFPEFKINKQYSVKLMGGHTRAAIRFFTDENGKIINVQNFTPCE